MPASMTRKYYSVAEVAELMGYSQWSIRKFCRQGLLRSMKRPGAKNAKLFIPASAVNEFLKEREL